MTDIDACIRDVEEDTGYSFIKESKEIIHIFSYIENPLNIEDI